MARIMRDSLCVHICNRTHEIVTFQKQKDAIPQSKLRQKLLQVASRQNISHLTQTETNHDVCAYTYTCTHLCVKINIAPVMHPPRKTAQHDDTHVLHVTVPVIAYVPPIRI
jgi:hypothetical protein